MIEVKFATITNKTDSTIIIIRFIRQTNAPAIVQEMVRIPAHKTVLLNTTIPFDIVDAEHNIGSLLQTIIHKEEEPHVQF